MGATPRTTVRFNGQLMAEDAAAKGFNKKKHAKRARVSPMAVTRFYNGQSQTPDTAGKLAKALGYQAERYLIRSTEALAS